MDWDKLEISLLVTGLLIAVGGKELNVSILVTVGMGIVALVIALVGIEAIVTRQMKWGITQHYRETYQGIAAISLGSILLVAGIGLGAIVIVQAFHQETSLFEIIFFPPRIYPVISRRDHIPARTGWHDRCTRMATNSALPI